MALRKQALFDDLGAHLLAATKLCPGLSTHLRGHLLCNINSAETLASLPVLRKSDLVAAQQSTPPFGGFVNMASLAGRRVFMSPGPVWEPQGGGADPWQSARALFAAGLRHGDRVHNAFSYHQTPGGFILDEGARALGCTVFPAGVGNTDAQVIALQHFSADAYIGTPDYLQTLLDSANTAGVALPKLRRALVSGGALLPSMRDNYRSAGIHVQQCYATADLGVIAYETASAGVIHPGMVISENMIVEIVKPGTGEPVLAGEVGEVVVTLRNLDYPLVRFATGDLSAFIEEASPCGRSNHRLTGWMGRADQRTKVRGMFIDPSQVQQIRHNHSEICQLRLLVNRSADRDVMNLLVSPGHASEVIDKNAVAQTLKRITGLAGSVAISKQPLPNDGVVIDDQRDYAS